MSTLRRHQLILALGDALALFITVLLGFQSHQTEAVFWQRFSFTFFPWLAGWFLAAPLVGLYEVPQKNWLGQSGRVLYALVLASPLAAILRGAWLDMPALPLFALIMGASSAVALVVWRLLYVWLLAKRLED